MKLALAVCVVCVALLAIVLVQAEDEMSPVRIDESRVINGNLASPTQLPFMAYVMSEDGPGTRHCGGSLITRDAVLTSAWCVYEHKRYTVRLGSIYRVENDNNAWTAVSIYALWHPRYNPDTAYSSVAIIYLPRRAPINEYIQLVDLPSSPNMGSFMCCHGTISGWGGTDLDTVLSEQLHWTEVIVVPNPICEKYFPEGFVSDGSLCAGSLTSAVYFGDDGGALVLNKTGGRFLQIGMHVSRVHPNFNVSKPALYARLTYFLDWIKMNTMHN